MTYATIDEAWGGISGSSMTQMPVNLHPSHKKEIKRRVNQRKKKNPQRPPRYKTEQDPYQCNYGMGPGGMYRENCNNIYNRNYDYNEDKKQIAAGIQHLPPGSIQYIPGHGYTLLPQYPWYPPAKYNYMAYGPNVSKAFYSNPHGYNPQVANQIAQHQMMYPNQHKVPIGMYKPQGFMPGYYQGGIPGLSNNTMLKRKEHFTMSPHVVINQNNILIFVFFLIVVAILLCLFVCALGSKMTQT